MLIEKYKGKDVKIFVSSDSGAGITASSSRGVVNSMLVICGKIVDIDEKYVELSSAQVLRPATFTYDIEQYKKLENFNSLIVNQGKIISVALLEDYYKSEQ